MKKQRNQSLVGLTPGTLLTFYYETPIGPRQTSNFCKQYCNKAIIFLTKATFFDKILLLLFKISWNNHQFTRWRKKYRFIAISLYRNIACKNCSSDEGLRLHCCPCRRKENKLKVEKKSTLFVSVCLRSRQEQEVSS